MSNHYLAALHQKLNNLERRYIMRERVKRLISGGNIFDSQECDPVKIAKFHEVKNRFYDFYKWIVDNVPENEQRNMAISQLESAALWINKSISQGK